MTAHHVLGLLESDAPQHAHTGGSPAEADVGERCSAVEGECQWRRPRKHVSRRPLGGVLEEGVN